MHNNISNAWKQFQMIAIDIQFPVKTGTVKGKGIRVKMFSTQDVENLDPFWSRVTKN